MPVVIVIGRYSVPAAIVRFKRVMRPSNTGVGACHHNILPIESERPHIRRMRVSDSRLNRRRSLRLRRRISRGPKLRKRILNVRIALNTRDIRPSSQSLGDLAAAIYQNCVNDIERLIFEPSFAEPLQNRALGGLALTPKSILHVGTFLGFCRQSRRTTQVGLISEYHEKLRLLTVGGMFHDPSRNLCRDGSLFKRATLIGTT